MSPEHAGSGPRDGHDGRDGRDGREARSGRDGRDGRGGEGARPADGPGGDAHENVGPYALGLLDEAESLEFEAHLAGCERCAAHLEEFAGLRPLLDLLGESGARGLSAEHGAAAVAPEAGDDPTAPAPVPTDRGRTAGPAAARPAAHSAGRPASAEELVRLVARERVRRRRHTVALVAAVALLASGAPLTVLALDGQDPAPEARPAPSAPAPDPTAQQPERTVRATDPRTRVTAVIGLDSRSWGTHTVLQLRGVKGPLTCSLLAVGADGRRETVSTWSVPTGGYGDGGYGGGRDYGGYGSGGGTGSGSSGPSGLSVEGGSSYDPARIDRFEVRTSDGRTLVTVRNF